MAFQVLQDPSRGAIGEAIGSAVSTGIQSLVQHKLGQIQEHKQRQDTVRGLQALGYSPKEATELSHFDPQIIGEIAKRKLAEPGEQAYANALSSLLGGQPSVQQAQPQQELPQAKSNALPSIEKLSPKQKEQLKQYLASPKAPKVYSPEVLNRIKESLEPKAPIAPKSVEQPKAPSLRGLNAKQATEIAKIGLQARKEEKALAHKEKVEATKETKKYYDQILLEEKNAREADDRLNKMERLVKKGNLPNSALYATLKNIEEHVSPAAGAAAGAALGAAFGGIGAAPGAIVGGAIGGLVGPVATLARSVHRQFAPDTEEFEKLSNQFIAGAKAIFGARITDQDLRAYMAQIPTLSNTDEGKLKIIADMKIANKAAKLRAKAMKDIIRQHGNQRPADLPLLVDEKIGDQLDRLSQEFIAA